MGLYGYRGYRRRRTNWYSSRSRKSPRYDPFRDSTEFVRARFFAFHDNMLARFIDYYSRLYGSKAGQYLKQTLPKWKNGTVRMSPQTEHRILECVPKYLSTEDQFELLVRSTREWAKAIQSPRSPWQVGSQLTFAELTRRYSDLIVQAKANTMKLAWFVENVFSAEELDEYRSCIRYIKVKQILDAFASVVYDLRTIFPLPHTRGCSSRYRYTDNLLRSTIVDINGINATSFEIDYTNPEPSLVTRIGHQNARLIIDRYLEDRVELESHQASLNIGVDEIGRLFSMLRVSSDGPEYEVSVVVNGRGGVLQLDIRKANIDVLRAKLNLLIATKYGVTLIGLFVVWSLFNAGHFISGIFAIIVSAGIVGNIHDSTQRRREELAEYE